MSSCIHQFQGELAMTIRISKLRFGALILAFALLAPSAAWATHVFVDVADGAFYAVPAEWAKTNNITTGSPSGSTTFKPLDDVTRGEAVTFLKRYHDNVVQPALDANTAAIPTVLWAKVNADGTKSKGSSAVASSTPSTGHYTIDFGQDITNCSWSANERIAPSIFAGSGDTLISLAQKWHSSGFPILLPIADSNQIFVSAYNAGALANTQFNIQVICP